MALVTFSATFSNGETITRNNRTGRVYTHAWATIRPNGRVLESGFSSSREVANRAAMRALPWHMGVCERYEVVEVSA